MARAFALSLSFSIENSGRLCCQGDLPEREIAQQADFDVSAGINAGEVKSSEGGFDFKKIRNFEYSVPGSGFSSLDSRCVTALLVSTAKCITREIAEMTVQGVREFLKKIVIGPGKFFWPTPGLCSLFVRTGTRKTLVVPPKPTLKTSQAKKTFAEVVREWSIMAAQGADNNGLPPANFAGVRGGGRPAGFNPGFYSGFNPGLGGRGGGRGRGTFPPRGRGRSYGGHGGYGYNGGYQGFHGRGGWHQGGGCGRGN